MSIVVASPVRDVIFTFDMVLVMSVTSCASSSSCLSLVLSNVLLTSTYADSVNFGELCLRLDSLFFSPVDLLLFFGCYHFVFDGSSPTFVQSAINFLMLCCCPGSGGLIFFSLCAVDIFISNRWKSTHCVKLIHGMPGNVILYTV